MGKHSSELLYTPFHPVAVMRTTLDRLPRNATHSCLNESPLVEAASRVTSDTETSSWVVKIIGALVWYEKRGSRRRVVMPRPVPTILKPAARFGVPSPFT